MKNTNINNKRAQLVRILEKHASLAVAFSGGVDSTYLLAMALEVLGDPVIAVTADAPIFPSRDKSVAVDLARYLGARHIIMPFQVLDDPGFLSNRRDRCYVCKKRLFGDILKIAEREGIKTVAHGANLDDLEDFRPGFSAARELGIVAPIMDAGLTKEDIRHLSKEMNLPTWKKPSGACLASRIPYETPVSLRVLGIVDQAENILVEFGFPACRVRYHGSVARIEIPPADLHRLLETDTRHAVLAQLRNLGFLHVAADLEGYVQGSLNRRVG